MPTAPIATTTVWRAINSRLPACANVLGRSKANKVYTVTSATRGPNHGHLHSTERSVHAATSFPQQRLGIHICTRCSGPKRPCRMTATRSQIPAPPAVTRDKNDCFAVASEFIDAAINLSSAPNIDTARQLIEHKHIHIVMKQACKRDFLLVSS